MAPGIKRRPTDELDGEQRLSKRFDLLNLGTAIHSHPKASMLQFESALTHFATLENGGKQYIGVHPSDGSTEKRRPQRTNEDDNGHMQVEDTKDKIYIYDLDKELEEIESDEDRPVFLADIEKHLLKLPKSVLLGDDVKAAASKQMVLYRVPTSLSVPEDKDSVRRAIIETRRRAQENLPLTIPEPAVAVPPLTDKSSVHGQANGVVGAGAANGVNADYDPDAMDIG